MREEKYADWPHTFDPLELLEDRAIQQALGTNQWGPNVEREHMAQYSLPSGKRILVIHQAMLEGYGTDATTYNRAIIAGEPARPLRFLGLVRKIRLIPESQKDSITEELAAILEKSNRKEEIEFW